MFGTLSGRSTYLDFACIDIGCVLALRGEPKPLVQHLTLESRLDSHPPDHTDNMQTVDKKGII